MYGLKVKRKNDPRTDDSTVAGDAGVSGHLPDFPVQPRLDQRQESRDVTVGEYDWDGRRWKDERSAVEIRQPLQMEDVIEIQR